MSNTSFWIFTFIFLCFTSSLHAQKSQDLLKFKNGDFNEFVEWKDTDGKIINAHDGGVIFANGKYYWYGLALRALGQDKGENNGAATTIGINLYSSIDLHAWKYEGVILSTSKDETSELRSPMRLERPKIIYNKKTNKFVMWFHYVGYPGNHLQGVGFADAGVAVADKITGPFKYIGHHRPIDDNGAVKDCTLFMDNDSSAYFVYDRKLADSSRCLYIVKLTDDFLSSSKEWVKIEVAKRREAPVIIKQNGTYYLFTSDVSGWKANEAKTFKTNNLMGPWTAIGNPCLGAQKENTFNTQCSNAFYFVDKNKTPIIMLERHNTANFLNCSYVWLPIEFDQNGDPYFKYTKEWALPN
jgi:beta-galactosidase